jgi:hypothetical protein
MNHVTPTTNTKTLQNISPMERVWITGDLSPLTPEQRVQYYVARCERAGLDPVTQPFEYLELQGKIVLYAKKTATDQLALQHKLSLTVVDQGLMPGGVDHYFVCARVAGPDSRVTDDQGVVWLWKMKKDPRTQAYSAVKLTGEDYSNAIMKCVTKAKRRAIIAHTGLGMLDETEVDSITKSETKVEETRPQFHSPALAAAADNLEQAIQKSHTSRVTPRPAPVKVSNPERESFTFPESSLFSGKTIEQAAQHAADKDLLDYLTKLEPQVLKKAKVASAYMMIGKEYPEAMIHKTILMRFRLELESRAKQGSKGPQAVVVNQAVTPPTQEQVDNFDSDFDKADQAEMGV